MAENIKGLSISNHEIEKRVKYEGIDILEKYSLQKNCAVVYMSIQRERRGYYKIMLTEMFANLQSVDVNTFLQRYIQSLESTINEQPAYWLWSHKRWKHKKASSN